MTTFPEAPVLAPQQVQVFLQVDIDEPMEVRVALMKTHQDLERTLQMLGRPAHGRHFLLLRLWPHSQEWNLRGLLGLAEGIADRVILTYGPEGCSSGGKEAGPFWQHGKSLGKPNIPVLVEPEADRAVIGAMQWLQPGDTLTLLWPARPGFQAVERLIWRGAKWRETFQEPEAGEFCGC